MNLSMIHKVSIALFGSLAPWAFAPAQCPGIVPAFAWSSDNTAIRFMDRTQDPYGMVDSVAWDFGDGMPGASGSPSWHTFAVEAVDTVRMTAWAEGCAFLIAAPVVHGNADDDCGVVIDPSIDAVQAYNNTIEFTNTSYTGGLPFEQAWSFGDEELSLSPTPTHTYLFPGPYVVVLNMAGTDTATLNGCVGGLAERIFVDGNASTCDTSLFLDLSYLFDGYTAFLHAEIIAFDPDLQVLGFEWSFGDLGPGLSGDTDPQHSYAYPGTYQVCLTTEATHYSDTLNDCSAVVCRTLLPEFVGMTESQQMPAVRIHPNPTAAYVELDAPGLMTGAEVKILDGVGRTVATMRANNNAPLSFNCAGLPAGAYTVRVVSGGKILWGRMVKQ